MSTASWHADRMGNAHSFIARAGEALAWGELVGETVMDIGCGSGASSLALISNFPKLKAVIAFDNDKKKLAAAQERSSHPKIHYQQADLENKFTLAAWTGEIEKAVSVYCFNCMGDKRIGYENLIMMLKPGGEAAIVQSINSPYLDFLDELRNSRNWSEILKTLNLGIDVEKTPLSAYRKMMEEIGFEVIKCFKQSETYAFSNRDECQDTVFRILTLAVTIPEEKREDIKEEAFRLYLKHNPFDREGYYTMTHCSMITYLRKPYPKTEEVEEDF